MCSSDLELESASLTQLDQTAMEFFNPSNAFDAEGLTRLTETIEKRKKLRNDIEQDTLIQIRNKNLETEKLALDIGQRGNSQRTEVVTLEAAVLEVATSGAEHRAGVRFSGLICEAAGSRPVPFAEIWHLVKPVSGTSGWVVAGIE